MERRPEVAGETVRRGEGAGPGGGGVGPLVRDSRGPGVGERAAGAPVDRPGLLLLAAAITSAVLWQVPYGDYVLYPFTILATWFHEMGHGLTAVLLGGRFDTLEMFSNGSGVARWSGAGFGRLSFAAVAAGGPLGPPVAGALFILAGRARAAARLALGLLAVALLLSVVLVVRSFFGVFAVTAWAVLVGAAAFLRAAWARGLAIQFLGVQACLATFVNADYLFRDWVIIDGQALRSDTGQMAEALLLPHWAWGTLLTLWSTALLAGSLYLACGRALMGRSTAPAPSSPLR
jgi:hypothetical protein